VLLVLLVLLVLVLLPQRLLLLVLVLLLLLQRFPSERVGRRLQGVSHARHGNAKR
jgi:hypothetical protein